MLIKDLLPNQLVVGLRVRRAYGGAFKHYKEGVVVKIDLTSSHPVLPGPTVDVVWDNTSTAITFPLNTDLEAI